MYKIMFIFGTRPEFIKMFPIIEEMKKDKSLNVIVLNTGQHKEMLDDLLVQFNVKPDYNLEIMQKCNGLTDILVNSLNGINEVIITESPDLILVHGDTSATLAGSIQAFYHQVKIGHVEAGLRTYNKFSPFPEEVNRQITGVIADYHFTPTETTKNNLLNEGKKEEDIYVVGNTAIDTLSYTIREDYHHEVLDWVGDSKYIMITAHRRENIAVLEDIFIAINQIAIEYTEYKFVYPVHLNPIIHKLAQQHLTQSNIKLIKPLETVDFHNIMKRAHIVLTDSGGIQEEAPSLGKPVLVLRDTTERPEGVLAGTLKLVGTDPKEIISATKKLLDSEVEYNKMAGVKNPYGDGTTSKQIVEIIKKIFEEK